MPDEMPERAFKMFEAMMEITWLIPLLGVFEIIGGILVIIPRWRALGALILVPIVVGIVLQHLTLMMGLPMTIIIAAVQLWILLDNRGKYLPLFKKDKNFVPPNQNQS